MAELLYWSAPGNCHHPDPDDPALEHACPMAGDVFAVWEDGTYARSQPVSPKFRIDYVGEPASQYLNLLEALEVFEERQEPKGAVEKWWTIRYRRYFLDKQEAWRAVANLRGVTPRSLDNNHLVLTTPEEIATVHAMHADRVPGTASAFGAVDLGRTRRAWRDALRQKRLRARYARKGTRRTPPRIDPARPPRAPDPRDLFV